MLTASDWVKNIVSRSQQEAMPTEDVLKSLERNVGQGEKALPRIQAILNYIDGELIDRRGGQIMRDLWSTVADYMEKVQEGLAAA